MKSYSQRQNQRLLREFVGPNGQIDPMAMPGQQQQNPMQMMGQQPGQQQPGQNPMQMMGQQGMIGQQANPMGQNPGGMGMDMGDMSGAMGGGAEMGDMSGAMGGQEAPQNPTNPADSLPTQLNAALRFMSGKSAQQIIHFQQQFNAAVQKMLTGKSKSAGKKGLWTQFQANKDAKANWGKPDETAP